MLVGRALLCALVVAISAIVAAILVLLIAPFAEESCVEEQCGEAYRDNKTTVRRCL